MPLVTHNVVEPGGRVPRIFTYKITLFAALTGDGQGHDLAANQTTAGQYEGQTTTGSWSETLKANSLITDPTGTVWKVVENVDGTFYTNYITVPNTAGPFQFEDLLTTVPGALPSAALTDHLADTVDAHDDTAISFAPAGSLAATTVRGALLELDAEKQPLIPNGTYVDTTTDQTVAGVKTFSASPIVPNSSFSAAKLSFDVATQVELDAITPRAVKIDFAFTPISHVNWGSPTLNPGFWWQTFHGSSGAQNDECNYDVILAAGTWNFELIHQARADAGIYNLQLDGVTVGTIDGYNIGTVVNTRSSINGIVVAATGVKRLKLKMATKNASSSSYIGSVAGAQLLRTA